MTMRRLLTALTTALVAGMLCLALPLCALAADESTDPWSVAPAGVTTLSNGTYNVNVTMGGGSGRASVSSPATVTVKDGKAVAKIEWSSQFYDYMLVDGNKYVQTNSSGNSQFEIPVTAFDAPMNVVADTVAMSTPHEVDYSFTFESNSAVKAAGKVPVVPIVIAVVAAVVVIIAIAVVFSNRKRKRLEESL